MKDPIEEAFKECEDSATVESQNLVSGQELVIRENKASDSVALIGSSSVSAPNKNKEENEGGNMDIESTLPSKSDWSIVSQLTEEQMNRFESFRRSKFSRAALNRLIVNVSGIQRISMKMTIVVAVCAKMFVGDLVEKARVVMTERNESGPIRPCHMREAYRRLKIEGKVPRRSVRRLSQ